MFKLPAVSMSIGMIIAIAAQATGQVPSGTKVGTLDCQLALSVGFIVGAALAATALGEAELAAWIRTRLKRRQSGARS